MLNKLYWTNCSQQQFSGKPSQCQGAGLLLCWTSTVVSLPARGNRGGSLWSRILANTLETDLAGGESECGCLVPRYLGNC